MVFFIERDGSVLGTFIRNELKEVINKPPITEPYDGWCGRTVDRITAYLLSDLVKCS